MKNFLIWLKVIKNNTNLKLVMFILIEHLVVYLLIYFITNYNIALSFILFLLVMATRSIIRMFVFYKKLIESKNFEQILLKPIDPLLGLIIYKMNIADIVTLLPVLIFLKFKNKSRI